MKKNTQLGEPGEVGVLARADQYVSALAETHHSIPAALAEEMRLSGTWGSAAITGDDVGQLHAQLAGVRARRESDVRRRSSAVAGLLSLEDELAQARASADLERSQLAAKVASEFRVRWDRVCGELRRLHSEAAALSAALGGRVNCPAPYTATLGVVSGQPEVRLSMPLEPQGVVLPDALASVASTLDKLDAVLAVVTGIRQSQQYDAHHYVLATQRGTSTEHGGVFRVIEQFNCGIDGLVFAPGELVNADLIGLGHLQRLQVGKRYIMPVELVSAAA